MEMCDVLNAAGELTGRTVVRGTQLAQDEYYLAVQVWIRNEAGAYLIQQRALNLKSWPGIWATTAGYVWAGEASRAGAIREVREELNLHLQPAQLRLFDRLVMQILIEDVWIAEVTMTEIGEPTISDEVAACKWASKNEIRQMIEQGDFFGYSYFERLPD